MEKYCLKFALVLVVVVISGVKQEADGLQMKMKMIHRHWTQSPFYRKFTSKHERIKELAWLDSLRIRSHDNTNSEKDIAPAEAPHTSFAMPVASGATLGSALYFVELYIGTPPQRALLVADTGSDLIWVNCNATSSNFTTFPAFSPDNSSSLSYVPCYSRDCYSLSPRSTCIFRPKMACKYSYGYLDSSTTSGPYVRDTITLKSSAGSLVKAEKVYMGCGTDNQGQSQVGSGGVLGLGQGLNSFSTQTSHLYGGKFSYCLVDYLEPTQVKSSLVFGDIGDYYNSSASLLQEPIQYTPILKGGSGSGSSFYYIGIEGITINGEKLPISKSAWEMEGAANGGCIIDSGTSLSYFIDEAYEVILEALKVAITYPRASTLSPQRFDLCLNTSGISDFKFPEISIELRGGQRFTPPSENYMLEVEDDVRCVGFSSLTGQSIIGNLLQQNFFVEYNRDRSVLGFAVANCSVHG